MSLSPYGWAPLTVSAISYGLFVVVSLGPVFLIPGVGSLPFICRLLFDFVDAVFMQLGALTVFFTIFRIDGQCGLALSRSWHFLFCNLSVSSGLPLFSRRIQAVSVVCLPVLPCHMLGSSRRCPGCFLLASGACISSLSLIAKSGFPSHSLPHSFFAPSRSDFATGLSVASFFCPVRP